MFLQTAHSMAAISKLSFATSLGAVALRSSILQTFHLARIHVLQTLHVTATAFMNNMTTMIHLFGSASYFQHPLTKFSTWGATTYTHRNGIKISACRCRHLIGLTRKYEASVQQKTRRTPRPGTASSSTAP